MSLPKYLFHDICWFDVDRYQNQKLKESIDSFDGNRLLTSSIEDLCSHFVQQYQIEVPKLLEDKIEADQNETQIDISIDPDRHFRDAGPHYIPGTAVNIIIPFIGDPNAFKIRPTSYTLNPPCGIIKGQRLILEFKGTNLDPEKLRTQIDSQISKINSYLNNLSGNAEQFNTKILQLARTHIETRRLKLLADQNLVAGLGFPLKKRTDSPTTYVTPDVRRKIKPTLPPKSTEAFKPEPTLESSDYEHIIGVIQNMAEVMERSPSAFSSMDEEALRSHFLVQLNGHYEGQATGETFNYEGKTDILVRAEGKNIFIGECKYWGGPKRLTETIDQILSYSCWRDTKVAIIIFNQRKNFTRVLEAINPTMEEHSNHKRTNSRSSETQFEYVFSHRDDPNRELTISVLAFDIPDNSM